MGLKEDILTMIHFFNVSLFARSDLVLGLELGLGGSNGKG